MYALFFILQMCQAVKAIIILINKNIILLVSKQVKSQEAQLYSLTNVPSHRLLKLEGHNLIKDRKYFHMKLKGHNLIHFHNTSS